MFYVQFARKFQEQGPAQAMCMNIKQNVCGSSAGTVVGHSASRHNCPNITKTQINVETIKPMFGVERLWR